MFTKWKLYCTTNPIKSLLIAGLLGSIIGIVIEYVLNGDILVNGIFTVLVVLTVLIFLEKKRK